jgi:iron(III) transport system substrate-binding protein
MLPWLGLLAGLAVAASPAMAADAPGAVGNAKLKEIIEAARKEGQLSIVVGEGSLGSSSGKLSKGMNDYYGLNLDVRFTPGPSMPNMVATVVQQYQAKRPATTDVITGYANHMVALIDGGAAEKVDWASWAPNIQRPELSEEGGAVVPFMTSTPGIAYNKDVIKGDDIPKTFQDLLNPKFKGRVVTTPYASGFDRLATKEMWGKEKTLEFAKKLSAQVSGLMRCNEADRLSTGEFDLFGLTCSQSNALAPAAKGAPIGFTLASDAPIAMFLYEAIPATSAHPNAAKLWINYLLSKEAQKLMYEATFQDLHLLEGSQTDVGIRNLEQQGVKFLLVDTNFYRTHDAADLDGVVTTVQEIFRNNK